MAIFQGGNKIGYSRKRFRSDGSSYELQETVFMRLNTMGMVQDIYLNTRGRMNPDFSLAAFKFEMDSGRFNFSASGEVEGETLRVSTSSGNTRMFEIPLENRPFLVGAVVHAVSAFGMQSGDHYVFDIFDPATMGQVPLNVTVAEREPVTVGAETLPAVKVLLNFKGTNQVAWVGENGEILKEKGLLGIHMEKTSRSDALSVADLTSSTDMTGLASVPSNITIDSPERLGQLAFKIDGVDTAALYLEGGRQTLTGNVLMIRKESLDDLPALPPLERLETLEKIYLNPGPFIESDHPKIRAAVADILPSQEMPALDKARTLLDWVYRNIEKRPVVSVPDALTTLENRVGDCNEHAVLLAALARSAGLPTRIETGLVYLDGRFYYHAWNLLFVGRWITADAVFGQMPADVTHIRFATGSQQQFDLMGVIGKVRIEALPELMK